MVSDQKVVKNSVGTNNYSLESTKTLQTESTWPYATADAKRLVVKITQSAPDPF